MPDHAHLPAPRLRAEIFRAGRPDLRFRLLVWFSAVIATLGLVADSAAVVIGAMLVAPLLGPIMAIGEASLGGRTRQGLLAARALIEGSLTAIVFSFVIAELLIASGFDVLESLPGEVQARTRPNPLDLGIALAGGAIGAYAVARMRDSAAVPGVAIATALMPPLCTVGIGLAIDDRGVWGGALLLFTTNLTAIVFSSAAVFWLVGLAPHRHGPSLSQAVLAFVPLAVMGIVLFGLSARAVGEAREAESLWAASNRAVTEVLPGAEVTELERSSGPDGSISLRLTVRTPVEATIQSAEAIQSLVAQEMQKKISLVLISVPVIVLDPLNPPPPDATVTVPPTAITVTPTSTPSPTSTPTAVPPATPTPTPAPDPSPTTIPPVVGNSPAN
jgi:uncharacterized hydrophobic protein (TIGR00271 family)